jgi:hypothetical protein
VTRLPDLAAYQTAIQHPTTAFADSDLRAATVTTNRLGLPKVAAGNFALTYQLVHAGRRWAVRCFHRDASDRQKRYAEISRTLRGLRGGPFVSIDYLPAGVRVEQSWFPVTKMPWLDGRTLNRFVESRLNDAHALHTLERRFTAMARELRGLGIAHGDLQHGNILIDDAGNLHLVDYDGMYVPSLKGLPASESGDPNYQHPARKTQFDAELDRFAVLVIVIALRALATAPELWKKYNTEDNLLFQRSDFAALQASPLFRDLHALPATRGLVERFAGVCAGDYARVPLLDDFLTVHPQPPSATAAHTPTAVTPMRRADVVILNRLFGAKPGRPRGKRSSGGSWSARRKVAQETLALSSDGRLVATAEGGGKVRVREAASGRVRQVLSAPNRIAALAFAPDGRWLLGSGPNGIVMLWSLQSSAAPLTSATRAGGVRAVAFSRRGPLVCVASGTKLELFRPGSDRPVALPGLRTGAALLVLSNDARTVAAASADGSLRCWSVSNGALLVTNRQTGSITALALSADGRLLASGAEGSIRLWAVPGGRLISELRALPASNVHVSGIAFSADASHVAAVVGDRVATWAISNGDREHTIAGPKGPLTALALSSNASTVVATTASGTVWFRKLQRAPTPPRAVRPSTPDWLKSLLRQVAVAMSVPPIAGAAH